MLIEFDTYLITKIRTFANPKLFSAQQTQAHKKLRRFIPVMAPLIKALAAEHHLWILVSKPTWWTRFTWLVGFWRSCSKSTKTDKIPLRTYLFQPQPPFAPNIAHFSIWVQQTCFSSRHIPKITKMILASPSALLFTKLICFTLFCSVSGLVFHRGYLHVHKLKTKFLTFKYHVYQW